MRKSFADVLKEEHIDIKEEYQKLYDMLFGKNLQISGQKKISMHDEIGRAFPYFYFRGTCMSIEEFDKKKGFEFTRDPENFSIDSLIVICEYIYNMLNTYQRIVSMSSIINVQFCLTQVYAVIEAVGYMYSLENNLVIFVQKSPVAISVAELMPEGLSYKVIAYNHYSMKGNLAEKKSILLLFSNMLEPKRTNLEKIDSGFTSDLFYAFNNFNIRHNNADPSRKGKFNQAIAGMSNEELEHWYDETYQMCLLAFLRLEQAERKVAFDELKSQIEEKR